MAHGQKLPAARERGLAAVELALLMPMLLFLVTGTAEFGRALYQYNILTKSVRDSAQYLARNTIVAGVVAPTDAQLTVAKNLVVYGQPTAGSSPLLPSLSISNVVIVAKVVSPSLTANYISVSASYVFQSKFGGLIPAFGSTSDIAAPGTLTASIRMRGIGQ